LFRKVLDPLDRMSEILFGIIMVLTFTGSIRVAEAGRDDLREVLVGALGCNLAWGVVDAVMYLMSAFMARARLVVSLKALRRTDEPHAAQDIIADLLPSELATSLTPAEVEMLRQRLNQQSPSAVAVTLTRTDWLGAVAVFLLVFLSTFPVAVPLIFVREPRLALLLSNLVAVLMLFALGWSLGRYAGRSGWRTALGMVLAGLVLVGLTMALGG
jgi:VIT1/CCC1 family predicted Fe2+/Mn2+ transporter